MQLEREGRKIVLIIGPVGAVVWPGPAGQVAQPACGSGGIVARGLVAAV
jgi:hypothetical protein